MASQEGHTAENSAFSTEDFVVVGIITVIARIQTETRDLVDSDSTDKVRTHTEVTAGSYAAAAFNAAVKQVDFFGQMRIHRGFNLRQIDIVIVKVAPGLDTFGHTAHPLTCVDRQVADEFEAGKRSQSEVIRKISCQAAAGQSRFTVNEHCAGTANTGTANEVELEGRILCVSQFIQENVESHRVRFGNGVSLQVRNAIRISRVVTKNAYLEHAMSFRLLGNCIFFFLFSSSHLLCCISHLISTPKIKTGVRQYVRSCRGDLRAEAAGTASVHSGQRSGLRLRIPVWHGFRRLVSDEQVFRGCQCSS